MKNTLAAIAGLLTVTALAAPPATEADLLVDAKNASRDGDYPLAKKLLGQCLTLNAKNADCTLALASTSAKAAVHTNDEAQRKKARELYERFLVLASADDPRVPRVKAILNAASFDASADPPSDPPGTALPVDERMTLTLGEHRLLKLTNVGRIAVRDLEIIDVKVVSEGLELIAMKAGTTTVLFATRSGQFSSTITVLPKP